MNSEQIYCKTSTQHTYKVHNLSLSFTKNEINTLLLSTNIRLEYQTQINNKTATHTPQHT